MNKLVSKNPVQRFKQGKKIVKAYGGLAGIALQQGDKANAKATPVDRGISQNALRTSSNKYTKLAKIGRGLRKFTKFSAPAIIGGFVGDWIGNKLWNSVYNDALEEGLRQREINRLTLSNALHNNEKMRFNAYQRDKEIDGIDELNQSKKGNSQAKPINNGSFKKSINKPVNNVWLKGYKHDEVKDVKAMQKQLMELGLLKDRFGADGKWGKNTEAAYQKYLSLKNIPVYEKPETPSVAAMAGIYSEENKPLYQRIRFKQGGQLPSRNIVKRFKNRKFN